MIKLDRLLIIGSANLEIQIYELSWLDRNEDRQNDNEAPPTKIGTLVAANVFEHDHDQGNVNNVEKI